MTNYKFQAIGFAVLLFCLTALTSWREWAFMVAYFAFCGGMIGYALAKIDAAKEVKTGEVKN